MNSIGLVMLRALKLEDDFVRLLCFSVQSLRRTCGSCQWAWIVSDKRVWFRVGGWRDDFRRRDWQKEESGETRSKKVLSRLFLKVGCTLFYIAGFSVILVAHSLFISKWCRNDSGGFRKRRCVDWCGDWWAVEGASHSCYQEPGTVGWGPQHNVPEAVHSRGRSRELLEQAFNVGNTCAPMRNLKV